MVAAQNRDVGRFSVEVQLANNADLNLAERGFLAPEAVRRMTLRGVVDTGATRLVLPQRAVDQLGLAASGEISVRYADGRLARRPLVGNVHLAYLDRHSVFNAIVEPDCESALIGAIVMEDLDLIADCTHQTLAPRDPKQIISESESAPS